MHFGARALIGPEIVARGQRPVGYSGHPIAFSTWLKTHRPLRVIHARHTAGRILIALVLPVRALRYLILALVLVLVLTLVLILVLVLVLRHRRDGASQHQQYAQQHNSG